MSPRFDNILGELIQQEREQVGTQLEPGDVLDPTAANVAALRQAARAGVQIVGDYTVGQQPTSAVASVIVAFEGSADQWAAYHRAVTRDEAVLGAEIVYVVTGGEHLVEWRAAFELADAEGHQPFRAVVLNIQTMTGHALNLAVDRASGHYLAFLTNGAVPATRSWLSRRWVDLLVGALRSNPKRGLVGGRTLGPEGRVQDASIRFVRREPPLEWLPAVQDWGNPRTQISTGQTEMPAVGPYGVMLTRETLQQVGGWSEDYWTPAYAGIDLCNRVWAEDLEVWYQPSIEVMNPGRPVAVMPDGDVTWFHDAALFSGVWRDWLWERHASPEDLLQASIDLYYAGSRVAGSRACDRLLTHPLASPEVLEQTRKNALFYSDPLPDQIDGSGFSDAAISFDLLGGAANGSMLIEGDRVHLLAIVTTGQQPEHPVIAELAVIDVLAAPESAALAGSAKVDLTGLGAGVAGRLAGRRADLWLKRVGEASATALLVDRPEDGRSVVSEVELDLAGHASRVIRVIDDVTTQGPAVWAPVPAPNGDTFVFRYHPTLVASAERGESLRLMAAWQAPRFAADFSESVPLIQDGAGFLTLVTQHTPESGGDAATHRILQLDEHCGAIAMSPSFCMQDRGSERIAGVGKLGDQLLIAYVGADQQFRLARLPIPELRSLLVPSSAFRHPGYWPDIDWNLPADLAERWSRYRETEGSSSGASGGPLRTEAATAGLFDLDELGLRAGTDKSSMSHNYLDRFKDAFRPWQDEAFDMLEIGVSGGNSIRIWTEWFPKARVVGLDIAQVLAGPIPERAELRFGSQADEQLLRDLADQYDFKVVIDDGSHRWEHQKFTFEVLFPLLHAGSVYVCEDLETSFPPMDVYFRDDTEESPSDYFLQLARGIVAAEYSRALRAPNDRFREVLPLVKRIDFVRHAVIIHKRH